MNSEANDGGATVPCISLLGDCEDDFPLREDVRMVTDWILGPGRKRTTWEIRNAAHRMKRQMLSPNAEHDISAERR